jgi:ketosteroid isomerase-like protein
MNVNEALDQWIRLWNTYDLAQVSNIFLNDHRVTYFSSEKEGLIKGIENLLDHHKKFGFVSGGKETDNKLWLEKTDIEQYKNTAIVKAVWYFQRKGSETTQRGPVTLIYTKIQDNWKIAHSHFSNY